MYYTELGIGNESFISTEIETEACEVRTNKMLIGKPISVYVRIWLGKQVLIFDSKEGIKRQKKTRRCFKLLIGIVSE